MLWCLGTRLLGCHNVGVSGCRGVRVPWGWDVEVLGYHSVGVLGC